MEYYCHRHSLEHQYRVWILNQFTKVNLQRDVPLLGLGGPLGFCLRGHGRLIAAASTPHLLSTTLSSSPVRLPTSAGGRWLAHGPAAAATHRIARSTDNGRQPTTTCGTASASTAAPGCSSRCCPSPTHRCRGRRGGARASLRAGGWEPPRSAVGWVRPLIVLASDVPYPGRGILHPLRQDLSSSYVGETQVWAFRISGLPSPKPAGGHSSANSHPKFLLPLTGHGPILP